MKRTLILVLMALCVGTAAAFWLKTQAGGLPWQVYIHETGRFLALSGFVLLLFQYIFSSRLKFIERGTGLDWMLGIHKPLGLITLSAVTLHPLLIFISERLQGYSTPFGFLKLVGLTSLLLLWVTAGSAMLFSRVRMRYESWLGIHRIGYLILPLAFFHSFFMGTALRQGFLRAFWLTLFLCFAAILAARIKRHYFLKRNPLKVSAIRQVTHDSWSIDLKGDHAGYLPGQFMFLKLKTKGLLSDSHPFTISSSPTNKDLSILAKSVGDFTSTLSQTEPSDQAYADMPYGLFSFLNHDADRYVFIAGGIGITPFLSMLRFMRDKKIRKEVILLWANRHERDIAFRPELEKMTSEISSFKPVYVLSRQADWAGEKGRLDMEKLMRHVGDFKEGEFFICGPPKMMSDLERLLRTLGVTKGRIHTERFNLR